MSRQRFPRIIIWLMAALILSACTFPLLTKPTQAPQSLAPESLGTSIVQTAVAAKTQTAINMPPSLTPSPTRFPTGTLIAVSSPSTFVFALPTFTPLPTWTPTPGAVIQIPGGGGNATDDVDSVFTGKEWTCAIREKKPPMGAVIQAGTSFYVSVTLFNTGTKSWPRDSVDFRYKSGFQSGGKLIQDFPRSVAVGDQITLSIYLTAPEKRDTYSTIWTLKVGRTTFCGVKYTFEVK
ncbi:MAG: hypothetical protein HY864_08630 [Chloroflexi bacterium]|nr:hypothetical protein [Chloroflexota bacterium]